MKSEYNFFSSLIINQIIYLLIFIFPYFDGFFKGLFNSFEFNNIFFYHPEYIFIIKNILFDFFNVYSSNMYISNYKNNIDESYLSPVSMVPQMLLIIVITLLFLIVYFSYFSNSVSEDNIIDHDFLAYNVTIEAEEEIGSIDDMILTSVILLYIFLWFFWIYSWSSLSITPQMTMSLYLFPFIYFIIFFIPFSLLYDYGAYFLTYLNGVGKSSVLALELLFDYIAVSIFYLRLMVQNVRLVFMLFTYAELHELIIFYNVDRNLLPTNESYNSWETEKTYIKGSSWFLFFTLPSLIFKWMYDLFHTFFMVIFQFIAFFAMIFWLFLFLYSMFVAETQENYITEKRALWKDRLNDFNNYKLSFSKN